MSETATAPAATTAAPGQQGTGATDSLRDALSGAELKGFLETGALPDARLPPGKPDERGERAARSSDLGPLRDAVDPGGARAPRLADLSALRGAGGPSDRGATSPPGAAASSAPGPTSADRWAHLIKQAGSAGAPSAKRALTPDVLPGSFGPTLPAPAGPPTAADRLADRTPEAVAAQRAADGVAEARAASSKASGAAARGEAPGASEQAGMVRGMFRAGEGPRNSPAAPPASTVEAVKRDDKGNVIVRDLTAAVPEAPKPKETVEVRDGVMTTRSTTDGRWTPRDKAGDIDPLAPIVKQTGTSTRAEDRRGDYTALEDDRKRSINLMTPGALYTDTHTKRDSKGDAAGMTGETLTTDTTTIGRTGVARTESRADTVRVAEEKPGYDHKRVDSRSTTQAVDRKDGEVSHRSARTTEEGVVVREEKRDDLEPANQVKVAGKETTTSVSKGVYAGADGVGAQAAGTRDTKTYVGDNAFVGTTASADGKLRLQISRVPDSVPPTFQVVLTLSGTGGVGAQAGKSSAGGKVGATGQLGLTASAGLTFSHKLSGPLAERVAAAVKAGSVPRDTFPEAAASWDGIQAGGDALSGAAALITSDGQMTEGDSLTINVSGGGKGGGAVKAKSGAVSFGVSADIEATTGRELTVAMKGGKKVLSFTVRVKVGGSAGVEGAVSYVGGGVKTGASTEQKVTVTFSLDPSDPAYAAKQATIAEFAKLSVVDGQPLVNLVQHRPDLNGTVTRASEDTSTTTGSLTLAGVKLDAGSSHTFGTAETRDANGDVTGVKLTSTGSSSVGLSGNDVQVGAASSKDTATTNVDKVKNRATGNVSHTDSETSLGKTIGTIADTMKNNPVFAAISAGTGGTKLVTEERTRDLSMSDDDYGALAAAAGDGRRFTQALGVQFHEKAGYDAFRVALQKAGDDRVAIGRALQQFIGKGSGAGDRQAIVERLLRGGSADYGAGDRSEFPASLQPIMGTYQATMAKDYASEAAAVPDARFDAWVTAEKATIAALTDAIEKATDFQDAQRKGGMLTGLARRLSSLEDANQAHQVKVAPRLSVGAIETQARVAAADADKAFAEAVEGKPAPKRGGKARPRAQVIAEARDARDRKLEQAMKEAQAQSAHTDAGNEAELAARAEGARNEIKQIDAAIQLLYYGADSETGHLFEAERLVKDGGLSAVAEVTGHINRVRSLHATWRQHLARIRSLETSNGLTPAWHREPDVNRLADVEREYNKMR